MKYLKIFEHTNFTYTSKQSNRSRDYYFETDKWSYKVSVMDNDYEPTLPYVGFKAKKIEDSDFNYDMSIITNDSDNIYKVMSTIKGILKDDYENNVCDGYRFSFIGDKSKSNQRLKLYQRVLSSDWNMTYDDQDNQFILKPSNLGFGE